MILHIRDLRQRAGITQVELAAQTGVTQSTISGWESGDCFPEISKLPALMAALHCTVNEIFDGPAA